jgi:hypothetical protein
VYRSVQYDAFEKAALCQLAELKLSDVTGRPSQAEDRVASLSGQLERVNRNLDTLQVKAMEADDVTEFTAMIETMSRQKKELARLLEAAKAESANQQGDTLGEFTTLCDLLAKAAPEDQEALRTKVRAALRRVVDEMRVVIVPRGYTRLVALQVFFTDPTASPRNYLMIFRRDQAHTVTSRQPWAAWDDLRTPVDVASAVTFLEEYPAEEIARLLDRDQLEREAAQAEE